MRNYIILNGQSSQDISGLLIQELPPITKPTMRTQIEEIDGRDGDIVTQLGFAAYDKQLTIGLYGEYDIDEIIAYFNSQGTVTFSNEEDKYYNYEIYEQIDFERLVRYKTATVTMHCQPFKYSTDEGAKTVTFSDSDNLFSGTYSIMRYSNGLPVATSTALTIDSSNSTSVTFTVSGSAYAMILSNTLELEPNTVYTISFNRTDSVIDDNNRNYLYDVDSGGNYSLNSAFSPFLNATGNISRIFRTSASGKIALGWAVVTNQVGRVVSVSNINVQLGSNVKSLQINNSGNYYSRPQLTLYGTGTVNLSLNGTQLFVINFGENANYLTIDTAAMEAYQDTLNTLMNRLVDGDYNNFKLNVGSNTITWSGDLSKIVINNYSRWL